MSYSNSRTGILRESNLGVGPLNVFDNELLPETLISGDNTFRWTINQETATQYRLTIGTTEGGTDILDTGEITATTYDMAILFNQDMHLTLYYRLGSNDWKTITRTFEAAIVVQQTVPSATGIWTESNGAVWNDAGTWVEQ